MLRRVPSDLPCHPKSPENCRRLTRVDAPRSLGSVLFFKNTEQAGRLRRKFMEKGVLFGKTNERVGRGGHERKRTAEQVVDLKNIDAPSDDDGVDDNNRQLQIVQEGDQDHHVLHRVHRQQRPPEVHLHCSALPVHTKRMLLNSLTSKCRCRSS